MKYLDTDSECHIEIIDDLQFSNLEDGFNYLARLECQLWTDGEIVKHLWTKTSNVVRRFRCDSILRISDDILVRLHYC